MSLPDDDQDRLNRKHLAHPRIGDYWHEMFSPVCVVVGRTKDAVEVCRTTMEAGPDHWTWDVSRVESMGLPAFAEWLSYKTEGLKDKQWCRVIPKAHRWVREAVRHAAAGAGGGR